MLKNLFKLMTAAIILGGAICISDGMSRNVSRSAALDYYASREYLRDRNIEFSPIDLQHYTVEAAKHSAQDVQLPTVALWCIAAGLVGGVFSSGSNTAIDKSQALFQRWMAASRKNDSREMAKIELEVHDDGPAI